MSEHDADDHERRYAADVAAYALGALEPAEAEAFARHLETCSVCAHELASFQGVIDDLALSAPRVPAPPTLRRGVMRAVADEPRPHPALRRAPRRPPRRALSLGTALAAVVAAVVVAIVLTHSSSPSTRVIQAQVTGPGHAALRVVRHRGELIVRNFPAPPRGKIYEVWLQHGHGAPAPTSALFSVTTRGDADVGVPGSLHGVSHVMVTPEPAGGSRAPTHAPVIVASLG